MPNESFEESNLIFSFESFYMVNVVWAFESFGVIHFIAIIESIVLQKVNRVCWIFVERLILIYLVESLSRVNMILKSESLILQK